MPTGPDGQTPDKTRLCPSCRCEISVLAVRCRFCGEEVGRPKDEARHFSIDDLGGETTTQYAPSGNVLDALESFRMEVFGEPTAPLPARKSGILHRRAKGSDPGAQLDSDHAQGDAPELDDANRALAALSLPTQPTAYQPRKPVGPSWVKKVGFLGGFIAALLILYFGGVRVAAVIHDWIVKPKTQTMTEYHNRAPELRREGAPAIDVLVEAAHAWTLAPTDENRLILLDARTPVYSQIEEWLDGPDWTYANLSNASKWATAASKADPNTAANDLLKRAMDEVFSYSLMVTEIAPNRQKAAISLNPPGGKTVKKDVSQGDPIEGRSGGASHPQRFVVESIRRDDVVLRDTIRNRRVVCHLLGNPRLYRD